MGRLIVRAEAAEKAGVAANTFSAYVHRGQAPAPVDRIGSTPLWDEDEISSWLETRPGRRGRPRGATTSRKEDR